MITWNVAERAMRKGWTNAYQLAKGAKITQPAAARVLADDPIERIDTRILETLARAFGCSPWALLDYNAEKPANAQRAKQ